MLDTLSNKRLPYNKFSIFIVKDFESILQISINFWSFQLKWNWSDPLSSYKAISTVLVILDPWFWKSFAADQVQFQNRVFSLKWTGQKLGY